MRKVFLSVFCMIMLCWFVPGLSVQAAESSEGWEYEYSGTIDYEIGGNITSDIENFTVRTHYPIYGYFCTMYGKNHLVYACVVPEGDFADDFEIQSSRVAIDNDGPWNKNPAVKVTFLTPDNWLDYLKTDSEALVHGSVFGYFVSCNVTFPVFENKEALSNFLESGDLSGWINRPDVDYSAKHDFSKDVYDPEIPTPELSNLSYNGFSITNIDGYYLDLIVDYSLLGVKTYKEGFQNYKLEADNDWKYTSHYYNFTLDNRAFSQDVLNINNTYDVDIEHDLIEDFKQWSLEYPEYKKLPTFSFFSQDLISSQKYSLYHVYKNGSFSDSQQLINSEQGLVYYYVRFYDSQGNYGQWVRYGFRSRCQNLGTTNIVTSDLISIGSVKSDSSGNPVVDDVINGSQDKETGEIGFNSNYVGIDISDVNSFFSYIRVIFNSISSGLDSFGSLISACFGFLPSEVIGIIIFGIVLMVFIGVIKAVIS